MFIPKISVQTFKWKQGSNKPDCGNLSNMLNNKVIIVTGAQVYWEALFAGHCDNAMVVIADLVRTSGEIATEIKLEASVLEFIWILQTKSRLQK